MFVSKVMHENVHSCRVDDHLATAASIMWNQDIGCLPVLDKDGEVLGMITDRDICMAAYTRGVSLREIPVSVAMSKFVYFCTPDSSIQDAEEKMSAHQIRRLPVLDENRKLVGVITLSDLAHEAERKTGSERKEITPQEVTDTLATITKSRTFQIVHAEQPH
jgi:CBS domain-containing protein